VACGGALVWLRSGGPADGEGVLHFSGRQRSMAREMVSVLALTTGVRPMGMAARCSGQRRRGGFEPRRARTGAGRTRGAFMARRDSSAAPGSQSGCGAWWLGH
jgi:hypothetical protein